MSNNIRNISDSWTELTMTVAVPAPAVLSCGAGAGVEAAVGAAAAGGGPHPAHPVTLAGLLGKVHAPAKVLVQRPSRKRLQANFKTNSIV